MKSGNRYGALISVLIIVWLILVSSAAKLLFFKGGPLRLGLAALVPIALFALWSLFSPSFRQFVRESDLRTLTFLQAWRVAGFVFVGAAAYGVLPDVFALPAGWGDLAVGLTAPLAAIYLTKPARHAGLIAWHFLGVLDLVIAVTLAVLASPGVHLIGTGMTTAPLTVLPLSLIPTFAVPLVFILHIACISKLVGRDRRSQSRVGRSLAYTASMTN